MRCAECDRLEREYSRFHARYFETMEKLIASDHGEPYRRCRLEFDQSQRALDACRRRLDEHRRLTHVSGRVAQNEKRSSAASGR